MDSSDETRRVCKAEERAFFLHLESALETGVEVVTLGDEVFRVSRGRGEDWVEYFVLTPVVEE